MFIHITLLKIFANSCIYIYIYIYIYEPWSRVASACAARTFGTRSARHRIETRRFAPLGTRRCAHPIRSVTRCARRFARTIFRAKQVVKHLVLVPCFFRSMELVATMQENKHICTCARALPHSTAHEQTHLCTQPMSVHVQVNTQIRTKLDGDGMALQ